MKIGRVTYKKGSEKMLGWKKLRLPRKRKKDLKIRWGNIWKSFIIVKNINQTLNK
jgi:hypothetical protein